MKATIEIFFIQKLNLFIAKKNISKINLLSLNDMVLKYFNKNTVNKFSGWLSVKYVCPIFIIQCSPR